MSWPLAAALGVARGVRRLQPGFRRPARIHRQVAAHQLRPPSYAPPRSLLRRLDVHRTDVEDWPVYRLRPAADRPAVHIVYFHGGAYVGEVNALHWRLASTLVDEVPAAVTVPVYPVAGRVGAVHVVATATRLVHALSTESEQPLVLLGDSAGAGLALAVTQQLLARDPDALARGRAPVGLVFVSPWLDAGCTDPAQPDLERRDPLISVATLRAAAERYADGLPLDDPRLSPLFGPMAGLPPSTVLTGTADVVHPDALRFAAAARAAGAEVDLRVLTDAPHEYPLLPFAEGRAARWDLVRACRRVAGVA